MIIRELKRDDRVQVRVGGRWIQHTVAEVTTLGELRKRGNATAAGPLFHGLPDRLGAVVMVDGSAERVLTADEVRSDVRSIR